MLTFIKSQTTSLLASLLDFLCTILCVEILKISEEISIITGNVSGGILYYVLSRNWVFYSRQAEIKKQFIKFWGIWLVNFSINFILVLLLIRFGHWHYLMAKTAAALTTSMTFNYIMNRKYVFKQ